MAIVSASYIERLDPKSRKSVNFRSCNGSKFKTTYEYQIIDGIKMLVPCGETCIYDEIQSYKESTDINNIITRFMNGETDLLNQVNGFYGDFTDVPDNYAEIFRRVQDCENVFNSLPVELRNKFDNSYQKFWSDFGSDSFNNIIDEFSKASKSVDTTPDPVPDPVNTGTDNGGVNNAE